MKLRYYQHSTVIVLENNNNNNNNWTYRALYGALNWHAVKWITTGSKVAYCLIKLTANNSNCWPQFFHLFWKTGGDKHPVLFTGWMFFFHSFFLLQNDIHADRDRVNCLYNTLKIFLIKCDETIRGEITLPEIWDFSVCHCGCMSMCIVHLKHMTLQVLQLIMTYYDSQIYTGFIQILIYKAKCDHGNRKCQVHDLDKRRQL